jgi:hypothetical protein
VFDDVYAAAGEGWVNTKKRVIPSRADGEGPRRRYFLTQATCTQIVTPTFVDRESELVWRNLQLRGPSARGASLGMTALYLPPRFVPSASSIFPSGKQFVTSLFVSQPLRATPTPNHKS